MREVEFFDEGARVGVLTTQVMGGRVGILDYLAPEGGVRPGAFVEVRVPDRVFADTIAVPDTAVYGTDTVYTAVDGKLVENKVNVVAFEGENALVGSGLSNGDQVLVTRITEVSAGLNVRREGEAPQRPAGRPTGEGNGQNNQTAAAPRRGRPTPEELAQVAKANNLSMEEFRALPMPKRRELIGAHRAAASAQ